MTPNWIDLDGLVNLRDVGGISTDDGDKIKTGRLLRSDNLQSLTEDDIAALLRYGLTDVIDLRSTHEVDSEGPGPLTGRDDVRIHHHSMFRESDPEVSSDQPHEKVEAAPAEALPWIDLEPSVQVSDASASFYLSYLVDRPDSVLASLRDIAEAPGAALVHCAAGKDRTGTVVALALSVAGANRAQIIADYAASTEKVPEIVDRLRRSKTYAANLEGRPLSSHHTRPETMEHVLAFLDRQHGGVLPYLTSIGWTDADTERLRAKLLND
ncbi:tyrosine-protein phosphatase [Microlunatus parietis]|uniref:Protein tyrosine/serine phosphatase n=1 Tax=Microlunatus parietis TaxID=682979 RepID=A0A7Y9I8K2_9ACTN|nr:tyrosine-protein phosphatase [Microlunatus parietis]NYE72070.1 protein tyrosine/serine phosphatase [Microlunatus parietis]